MNFNVITSHDFTTSRFETFPEDRAEAEATGPGLDHSQRRRRAQRRLWRRTHHQWKEEKGVISFI